MRYFKCPKCDHAPLPRDQALPAACPACGLVLAKYGAAPPTPSAREDGDDEDGTRADRIRALLFPEDEPVQKATWQARVGVLGALAAWTLWIWFDMDIRKGEAGSTFLHLVLLPFHEAGHYAIFRWFGEFIMTLGGTLGQHLMPIVLGVALLWKRRDAFGAAVFAWLLGFSVIDMAVYMYDAFDPRLMLLGGKTGQESDGHDWQNLFGDLGIIRRSRGIGLFFGGVGMAIMASALAWAARVLALQRRGQAE
ncbi:MAG TPA: hypothetical protein VFV90_00690 [Usitatibacter sp.]|nr:hypothetical protein [Usitatibacter sp.]